MIKRNKWIKIVQQRKKQRCRESNLGLFHLEKSLFLKHFLPIDAVVISEAGACSFSYS